MNKRRPNIIFILADDLGWRDLSCYGSRFYETPHLDRLHAQGMHFTNAYAACPVCSPTRASILTGKYPANVGVTNFIGNATIHPARGRLIDAPYIDHLPRSETSLAAALHGHGYQTWHVGKWHLGEEPYYPERHGFDVNIGGCDRGMPKGSGYFSPWPPTPGLNNADVPDGTHLDDHLGDRAAELIRRRDPDRPFFLNFWSYLVHTPIEAEQPLIDKYARKAHDLGLDKEKTFEEGEPFPTFHKRHQRVRRRLIQSDPTYAAMVETLDRNVGKLLTALEAAGEADNTLVVFTSDNGGLATAEGSPTCNAPLAEGKGWMYEGGTREPLIVHWPGVTPAGARCDVPVSSPDFYPTFLSACGLDPMPEQHVDGVDITALLRGETPAELINRPLYWHFPHYGNQGGTPGSSVRCGDHKLIEFFEDGRRELYDLRRDISEAHNLADEQPQLRDRLHAMLTQWRRDCEAKLPQPNPDFKPMARRHQAPSS